jgi:hypothetical protein
LVFFLTAKLFADAADADGCFLIALRDVVVDPEDPTSVVVADDEGESVVVGWFGGVGVIICHNNRCRIFWIHYNIPESYEKTTICICSIGK